MSCIAHDEDSNRPMIGSEVRIFVRTLSYCSSFGSTYDGVKRRSRLIRPFPTIWFGSTYDEVRIEPDVIPHE
jgi:hypothetical protein